ncbi:histone-lysine N-methyltransferase SETMAR-like [Aphis craccivora]|uniref:Histone-lysine N-methyltransferase SETMAR-like n=1 Tax=Aphis craccivora TaxID=307492 RepID=A0A6G0YCZ4_APHCR|nr:histone-lysine N-methyltransferase SETMAR-like [Aphis craccivora]
MCESDNESENNSSAHVSVFEQRAYIKIETIRGKTVPEIHAALNEVCGTDTVDRSTVQRWYQRFRDGRISIDNNPRSGRPSTVTQDNTKAAILATLLNEDRRIEFQLAVVTSRRSFGEIWLGTPQTPTVFAGFKSPLNFDLFPKLKEQIRGIRFPNLDILNEEVSRRIRELNKDGVLCGIQALPKRWESCIDKQGDYIEGQ